MRLPDDWSPAGMLASADAASWGGVQRTAASPKPKKLKGGETVAFEGSVRVSLAP